MSYTITGTIASLTKTGMTLTDIEASIGHSVTDASDSFGPLYTVEDVAGQKAVIALAKSLSDGRHHPVKGATYLDSKTQVWDD